MKHLAWLAVVGLVLGGCGKSRSDLVTQQCVWTECSPKSIAMNRCSAQSPPYSEAFDACLRLEGYEEQSCDRRTAECIPRSPVAR